MPAHHGPSATTLLLQLLQEEEASLQLLGLAVGPVLDALRSGDTTAVAPSIGTAGLLSQSELLALFGNAAALRVAQQALCDCLAVLRDTYPGGALSPHYSQRTLRSSASVEHPQDSGSDAAPTAPLVPVAAIVERVFGGFGPAAQGGRAHGAGPAAVAPAPVMPLFLAQHVMYALHARSCAVLVQTVADSVDGPKVAAMSAPHDRDSLRSGVAIADEERFVAAVQRALDAHQKDVPPLPEEDPLDPRAIHTGGGPAHAAMAHLLSLLTAPLPSLGRYVACARALLCLPHEARLTDAAQAAVEQFLATAAPRVEEQRLGALLWLCERRAAVWAATMTDWALPRSHLRVLVAKGRLLKKFARGRHERLMFVFSDALVYCEEVGRAGAKGSLRVRGTIPFADAAAPGQPHFTVADLPDRPYELLLNAFEVRTKARPYIFCCGTPHEKAWWLALLRRCLEAALRPGEAAATLVAADPAPAAPAGPSEADTPTAGTPVLYSPAEGPEHAAKPRPAVVFPATSRLASQLWRPSAPPSAQLTENPSLAAPSEGSPIGGHLNAKWRDGATTPVSPGARVGRHAYSLSQHLAEEELRPRAGMPPKQRSTLLSFDDGTEVTFSHAHFNAPTAVRTKADNDASSHYSGRHSRVVSAASAEALTPHHRQMGSQDSGAFVLDQLLDDRPSTGGGSAPDLPPMDSRPGSFQGSFQGTPHRTAADTEVRARDAPAALGSVFVGPDGVPREAARDGLDPLTASPSLRRPVALHFDPLAPPAAAAPDDETDPDEPLLS